jgi:excisionase family DNA binding protein
MNAVGGDSQVQNPERQGTGPTGGVRPEFFDIRDLSRYLGIRPSTLYVMVEERNIPHYRVGKLIRFKRSEIDLWMEGNKKDCVAPEKTARKALAPVRKPKIDIDRVVRKAIDETKGEGYTTSHGKPDQVKGLRKEAKNGTL